MIKELHVPTLSNVVFEDQPIPPPVQIPWYPDGLAWQFNVPKKFCASLPSSKNSTLSWCLRRKWEIFHDKKPSACSLRFSSKSSLITNAWTCALHLDPKYANLPFRPF
ncbi:hypothetical protein BJ912DRAFT_952017, partial [Pholiota molesta]